jgi:hypothetical protein
MYRYPKSESGKVHRGIWHDTLTHGHGERLDASYSGPVTTTEPKTPFERTCRWLKSCRTYLQSIRIPPIYPQRMTDTFGVTGSGARQVAQRTMEPWPPSVTCKSNQCSIHANEQFGRDRHASKHTNYHKRAHYDVRMDSQLELDRPPSAHLLAVVLEEFMSIVLTRDVITISYHRA